MSYDQGPAFQRRIIAAAWKDGKLLKDKEVFNPAWFSEEILSDVARCLIDLAGSNGGAIQVPDLPGVEAEITKYVRPGRKHGEYAEELRKIWARTKEDLSYYKRAAIDFARHASVGAAIQEAVQLVGEGQLDKVESLIRRSLRVGGDASSESVDLLATAGERALAYSTNGSLDRSSRVPTGIGPLDSNIRGGLGPGELGCVFGVLGTGKSHVLINFGSSALLSGHPVLHVSLENSSEVTQSRYDTLLFGRPLEKLSKLPKKFTAFMSDLMSKLKSRIHIRYFPSKSLSLGRLESFIESSDTRPEMVVVDAGYQLSTERRRDDRRHELVDLYEGLRAVAGRTGTRIWTAHQANRLSLGARLIDKEHQAECFEIGAILDVGFSLNVEETKRGQAILYLFKNRLGPSEIEIPCFRDWSISKITAMTESVS